MAMQRVKKCLLSSAVKIATPNCNMILNRMFHVVKLKSLFCLTTPLEHIDSYHRLLDVIHMVTLTHLFRRKPAAAT